MPLGVVHLLQVSVVADRLDALLQRNDLVVASHDHDGATLELRGQVQGADRDVPAQRLDVLVEYFVGQPGLRDRGPRALELGVSTNGYTELVGIPHRPTPAGLPILMTR
jgi:hypothetical protein